MHSSFHDVSELLMRLIAHGGGAERLDELYRIIEKTPGSTEFTAEDGRDALLVAAAYFVRCLADYRLTLDDGHDELALGKMRPMVDHLRRIAVLCDFLHRSGEEAVRLLESGVSPRRLPYYTGRQRARDH